MALRGNLKELSLPDIFQLVTFSGKTGVLRIHRPDGAQGSVWFRDGDVFFAQSNWRTEPLGERLVRAQRITPMALERALELRNEEPDGGRRLGEILVDGGYITDKVLEAFVQEQMQDTIFDLMRWDDGDFEFEAMPDTLEEDIGLAVSIENVIMEGSRRLEEWNRIKKKIPSTDIVLKMATAPGEGTFEISLKPIEWNLLLLVDGTRSVAELAVETGRTDFEVARILYGLFSAGLLEFATDEEVAASRAERYGREAKLAELEAKRIAEERAAAQAVAGLSAQTLPVAAGAATPEAVGPVQAVQTTPGPRAAADARFAAPPAEPVLPAEVPEFLGADLTPSTHDDVAVLEAAMGAVLETKKPAVPAPAEPAGPYTPGEEPAFIAASREAEAATEEPQPSVEELFADLAELPPVVEGPAAARVSEAAARTQPEAPLEVAPAAAGVAVPGVESLPAVEPVPEAGPAPEPASGLAQALEREAAGASSLDLEPDLLSVAAGLEGPETQVGPPPVLEPGTYVIVPGPLPPQHVAPTSAEQAEKPVVQPVEPLAPSVPEPPTAAALAPASEPAMTPPSSGAAAPTPPGLQSFEHDLMSLGLGELPVELRAAAPPPLEMVQLPAEEEIELEPVVEPMGVSAQPAGTPAPAKVGGEADFSALLESLDISADDARAAAPSVASAPLEPEAVSGNALLGEPGPATAGVISTDSYLDDLTLEGDLGLSGELTDELSALTGADRPLRPVASVRRLPAEGETLLHRDTRVDRDTLLKIIEGVKNL